MSKRRRDENCQVLIQGFGKHLSTEDVLSVFCQFGKIDFIKFFGQRQCIVQFEQHESVSKALILHNTKQPKLLTSSLSVSSPENPEKPPKKFHSQSGSFVILDPPRFNNYYIPVLPSFLTNY